MLAAMGAAGGQQGGEQIGRIVAPRHHLGHRVVKQQPGAMAARPAAQRRRDRQAPRLIEGDRHFRKPVPAQPATEARGQSRKRRELDPVDPHRQDRRLALVGD